MDPVTATALSEAVEQELGGPDALKILEEAPDGLVVLDGSGRLRFANATARRMAAPAQRATLQGEPFELAFPDLFPPQLGSRIADGRDVSVIWRAGPWGCWTGWFAPSNRLVSARSVDDLTGLGDRKALREALRPLDAGGASQTGRFVVLCLDLDHFKSVNDTLGHAVGDAVLKKAAQRLERCVRRSDALFRVGGDEFVVLLTEPDAEESAAGIAKRIVEILGRPYLAEGHQATVGVSVGVALSEPDDASPENALRRADMALYDSKRTGRRRATWFRPSMAIELEQRRILEAELRCALLLKQFELHYQPQMNASTGEVVGFEALVRWRHPERGLVSPAAFIPVAEETGMIEELGRWVLLEACRTAAGWPDHVSIAVNVSAVQFAEAGFDQVVFAALEASGLSGARLELEVTESVLIKDEDLLLACMNKLRARGVRLSLDDFGTGYSSLSYLERIPFDKVKIDQSFVRVNAEDRAVVATIAALGQAKGMEVLAEGVETGDQLDSVVEVGCRSVQGFLFSRPLPAEEAMAYLDEASAKALRKG